MQIDIVDFKEPKDGQLYVTKIAWSASEFFLTFQSPLGVLIFHFPGELELKELMQRRFSVHGLLHWIKVSPDSSKGTLLHKSRYFLI